MNGSEETFFPRTVDSRNIQQQQEIEFNPTELATRQDIVIDVSNCAPRSNASYEEAAQKIFELQMKYSPAEKGYPDLITPEEFISWLNIPKAQKSVLLDRMTNQMEKCLQEL